MRSTASTTDADQPVYISVKRPRCPRCGGVKLRTYKSIDNGDGSVTRYSRCRDCDRRMILIVE